MANRLCENMLILIKRKRNRNCNRTLCNLNLKDNFLVLANAKNCNRTLCNLNAKKVAKFKASKNIVIVHYVI